jgi:hypothetical protein
VHATPLQKRLGFRVFEFEKEENLNVHGSEILTLEF